MAIAFGEPGSGVLTGFLVLAACVWTGGLVAIFVAARVAHRTLRPADRVAFFRGLGRAYGPVGGAALTVALGCGAALLSGHAWDAALTAAVVIAVCLLAVTGAGVVQARHMTRVRRDTLSNPGDRAAARRVRLGAVRAAALRSAIAVLTVALLAVGVLLTAQNR
jgi:hypothetical protein